MIRLTVIILFLLYLLKKYTLKLKVEEHKVFNSKNYTLYVDIK